MRDLFGIIDVKTQPEVSSVVNGAGQLITLNAPESQRYLYRDDIGGSPIGIVGGNFNVLQPQTVLDEFMRCVESLNGVDANSVQINVMRGGSKINAKVKVAEFGFMNDRKKRDDIDTWLSLSWGYDGWTKIILALESFRLICTNGWKIRGMAESASFKNYSGSGKKLTLACDQFTSMIDQTSTVEDYFKALNKVSIKTADVNEAIRVVMGYNKDTEGLSAARISSLEALMQSIDLEISRSGGNAWGLLNGFTHFTNHSSTYRTANVQTEVADRAQYLFDGKGAEINDKAQKFVAELVA